MKNPSPQRNSKWTRSLSAIFAAPKTPLQITALALLAFAQSAGAASTAYTWTAASGNWSNTNDWSPLTVTGPTGIDSVTFGVSTAVTSPTVINNTVDFTSTVTNYTANATAVPPAVLYNVTQIPAGQTLNVVSGNMLVGGVNGPNNANTAQAYFVGAGSLVVTATNLMVQNYDNTTRAGATAFMNLAGLTNFVYRNTIGVIRVEDRLPGDGSNTGLGGNLILAGVTNIITAATLNLGTSSSAQAGAAGTLVLGSGTNVINAATINIASQKSTFTVNNTGGGLRIRGLTGADSDNSTFITIGNRNVGGGTGIINGNMLLNGCAVDIKAGTLIVGQNNGGAPSSAADGGNGLLQFDTGTVSANTLIMANNTSANNANGNQALCNGIIDVGSHGTLLIGAGQVFDLASEGSSGPSTGTLIISNGLVNCQGPIAMGPNVGGTSSGSIVFLTGGTLNMGPNSYVGTLAAPITTLTLTNNTLSVSIPSVNYTNICVVTNNWPTPDSGLTISVAAMPAGILPGAVFPFLTCSTFNGTFTSPKLTLPPGVQGFLSLVNGTNMYLTITAGVGPGTGGVEDLTNASFETVPAGTAGWTATGAASVVTTNVATTYPNTGSCTVDTRPIQILDGTNVAKLTGSFVAGGSTNSWSQSVPVVPGSSLTAGAFSYVAHEDMLSGSDSFYCEVDFKDASGNLLTSYESVIVTNMTCGGPNVIPLDTWASMAITNQMQVTAGKNTGVVIGTIPSSVLTVPPQTATATFKAVLIQRNATDTGSVYFDAANIGFLSNPVPPSFSAFTPDDITFCTNAILSGTVSSTETTISSVQVVTKITTLGGATTNRTTNVLSAPYITGLGTPSATVNYPLTTNVIYLVAIITATDADGITVSTTNSFDTLVPTLVVEASDYNFSNGQFFDTPSDGGVGLYTNQVASAGVDYQKASRAATPTYYRLGDPIIMQPASPAPPTGTEQKYISAAASGDMSTNDVELEVGYNTPGDWDNYSRTFGPGGSAPAGTYNVWCYLATATTGIMSTLSQVTSDPTQGNQTTNFVGTFGTSSFTDSSYNSFVYVPLVDQFGNRVSLTISNGVQTFKNVVVGNPNIGFFLFVPVAPIYTPVLQNFSPNGSVPFQSATQFTFTVGAAQGNPISTNGIGLVINGVPVTSGLTFTAVGSSWTVNYAIASNEVYTAVINVTNTAGLSATYTPPTFDTFNANNFQWEAVDYDFSTNNGTGWNSGLFIDNSVPTGNAGSPSTGQFATNSYYGYPTGLVPGNDPYGWGSIAQQGIDINFTNIEAGTGYANYRPDGVGSMQATDYLRPKFLIAQTNFGDPTICPFNVGYFNGGNWLNYTRTFPTNFYNVWARLAGGNGAFSGTTLSMVTSGVGTSNQTLNVLGSFADANPAGWQSYHWIPLLDTNGNPVVVYLGGQQTLRLTSGNNLNAEFMMLAPATAAASAFSIGATLSGTNIQISFPTQSGHTYTLWTASSLTGSWSQVGGSQSGDGTVHQLSEPLTGSQGYFRVVAQ